LTLDDYVIVEGRTIALEGGACERAQNGTIDGVYFGYECDPSTVGGPLCDAVRGSGTPAPIADLITAQVQDGGASDGARPGDATPDASGDAHSDGTLDASPDAPRDASDGGGDGGATGTRVECESANTYCTLPDVRCCPITPTQSTCLPLVNLCAAEWRCDDARDCASGEVCCRTLRGNVERAVCTTPTACSIAAGFPTCSSDWGACPPNLTCTLRSPTTVPGTYECATVSGGAPNLIECSSTNCTLPQFQCCATTTPSCTSSLATCPGKLLACDDSSDCTRFGFNACCFTGESSACVKTPIGACPNDLQNLCSLEDDSCPVGTTCRFDFMRPFAKSRCE